MTHEAGIEAAAVEYNDCWHDCQEYTVPTDVECAERIIQAYLSASGMVLVPADQIKYLEAELELAKGRIKDRYNMLRNLAMSKP